MDPKARADNAELLNGLCDLLAQCKSEADLVARMSQIAFFTRDGDMRDPQPRISRPTLRAQTRVNALVRGRSSGLRPSSLSAPELWSVVP
jgi:hypothetical protein